MSACCHRRESCHAAQSRAEAGGVRDPRLLRRPGEGTRVTPERTQLADDVDEVLPAVHEEYTEPMIILFPGLSIFSAF